MKWNSHGLDAECHARVILRGHRHARLDSRLCPNCGHDLFPGLPRPVKRIVGLAHSSGSVICEQFDTLRVRVHLVNPVSGKVVGQGDE